MCQAIKKKSTADRRRPKKETATVVRRQPCPSLQGRAAFKLSEAQHASRLRRVACVEHVPYRDEPPLTRWHPASPWREIPDRLSERASRPVCLKNCVDFHKETTAIF